MDNKKNECTINSCFLAENINTYTQAYAVKYPTQCTNDCDNCIYHTTKSDFTKLKNLQKDVLLELFNEYHLTLRGNWVAKITNPLKIEIMSNFLDENRTLFVRERERILCTESFRRLQYKTQVMVNSVSDDQRTRLLHSIEVQNMSRKIAVGLKANYELTETIALAHDIGHAPFGHAGEHAIDEYLQNQFAGNFSHALQGVKVIDFLCSHRFLKPRGLFGLGVSDYVLEGILKHDSDSFSKNVSKPSFRLQYDCPTLYNPVGLLEETILPDNDLLRIGGIETQIVYWADKIAYKGHEWEEFVQVGLLEKMLERVNGIVIEMHGIVDAAKHNTVFTLDERHKSELFDIIVFLNTLTDFHKYLEKAARSGATTLKDKEFDDLLSELIRAVPNASENKKHSFFSQEQYDLLKDYFSIAEAWIGITNTYPNINGGKFDTIFVIYDYLANTTSHRISPNLIQLLITDTIENINKRATELYIQPDEITRDQFIQKCNEEYANHPERSIAKSFIVSYNEEHFRYVERISEFIKAQLIKSTRIRFMTLTAETIINRLLSYYQKHSEMLPLKQRKRIEIETEANQSIVELLKQYYWENVGNEKFQKYISDEITDYYEKNWPTVVPDIINSIKEKKQLNEEETLEIINEIFADEKIKNYFVNRVIVLRIIVDYISGMTDRMAEKKYNEIVSSSTNWSKEYSEMATFTL